MKANYTEGRSGFFKEGEILTNSALSFGGGFCIIKSKGATSYFDTLKDTSIKGAKNLEVGMPIFLKAWTSSELCPLKEGDEVIPIEMHMSCWTTDCPASYSEGSIDRTSQCDIALGKKDLAGDGNISESGTINGYYESESEMQRFIEDNFITRIIDKDDKVSLVPINKNKTYWHWFKTREENASGEVETTLIRKIIISGFSAGQPSSGATPFNFSYTTLESYNYSKEVA